MRFSKFILVAILLLAVYFRFNNLNWDENAHLHPDERFLTMVGNAMKIPENIARYFEPDLSTFNPVNIGYKFFVYGVFPVTLNKILAVQLHTDNYNSFTVQGRLLSAMADLLVVFLVYKIAELLLQQKNDKLKYFAAFFYAIAVLPIQLSHYFAVDTFLNLFMIGSFYFALKFYSRVGRDRPLHNIMLSAFFFGLAMACKITAVFILPLNLFFIFIVIARSDSDEAIPLKLQTNKVGSKLRGLLCQSLRFFLAMTIYFFISYISLRIFDPYIFQSANLFDPMPSQVYVGNLKSLKSYEGKDVWYPPAVQWLNKPAVSFSLVNLVVFGVGVPYALFILIGILEIINNFKLLIFNLNSNFKFKISNLKKISSENNNRLILAIILIWVTGFFLYQSIQFVKAMRYFIFIYPFLAIFAAIGLLTVIASVSEAIPLKPTTNKVSFGLMGLLRHFVPRNDKVISYILYVVFILVLLIWPLMFSSIYLRPQSRIVASEWIYKNLSDKGLVLNEHWDDPLPLLLSDNYGKQFKGEQLPVFGPDNSDKWQQMDNLLSRGSYYILSSNRGWGSIPTVPERYPLMTKFYHDLFAGKTNYKKIAEFTSYPKLEIGNLKLEIKDDWAEEAFTVYDHPHVYIFKKI